ncbi:MAG: NAD-dependent epimerase/dehydratase family protein [bacterium]
MTGRRALVTGGAGFIGSHLADRLLKDGWSVHVIDDLSTGSRDNVSHLEGKEAFGLTIDSVLNADAVAGLVAGCDTVFHLAAAVGVEYVIGNQLKSIRVNVGGAEVVLGEAARAGKKVVLFSTSEIYGKSDAVPFKEDDDRILGPTTVARWGYAVTKALDEILTLAYVREAGLAAVIVRCFNTCGPRQTGRYGMVVPRLVKQALAGRPITVYGDGNQTRCFASVYDVVDGVARLAECPQAEGGIFNIGSDKEVTIRELAERVRAVSGSASPIEYVPYEQAYGKGFEDMARRVPDLERVRATIGYRPRVDLDGIIASVVDYLRTPGERART